jgi:2-(1,2-epoxy-1,2-dihydrophenyl)acetyl-CoA isomerase
VTTEQTFPGLGIDVVEGVAVLTFLDAGYSLDNLSSIARAVRALQVREDIAAIVLRGCAGNFSIGATVPLLEHLCALDEASRTQLILEGQDNVRSLLRSPKLTVAYVDGFAAGGGVDLMLACDRSLVTSNSRVNLFYSKLGVVPDDGALYLLAARVGWPKALRLAEASESWSADDCLSLGLADRSLEPGMDLSAWPRALRKELRLPGSTRAALKRLRWSEIESGFEAHLLQVASAMSTLLVQPEQRQLIARTASVQRMQAAPKDPPKDASRPASPR